MEETQTAIVEGGGMGGGAGGTRAPVNVLTPMEVLRDAVAKGAPVEALSALMDLQERWEKNQARKAFDAAMAAAKAEMPVINKNRQVGFESKKTGAARTDYRHEDLAEIARTVDPVLAKFGLSYRFRTASPANAPVSVTCVVSHRDGYSEENTLEAGRDDSGNKNSIQAIGSTVTYLQRYTLKAALGLAVSADDDARSAEPELLITEEQVEALRKRIADLDADPVKILAYLGVEKLADLTAAQFDKATVALDQWAKKVGKGK